MKALGRYAAAKYPAKREDDCNEDAGPQAAAAEVLRHQVGAVGFLAPVEDGHDMGMVQGRGRPGLGPEPAQERFVVGQGRVQELECHPPAEPHVVGEDHVGRRAGTNRGQEAGPASQDATEVVSYPGRSHRARVPCAAGPPLAIT